MNTNQWKATGLGAALLLLGAISCTDPTVAPQSTLTSANFFNDPSSYLAFITKVYGGLALSGQQGPAGQPDIQGIDEGFSQYMRLYWEAEELPTDEAVIAWGDPGLPFMNTQTWDATNPFANAMYYRILFQAVMANEFLRQTTPDKLTARGVSSTLRAQIQQYRAEARFLRALSYWHGMDLFGSMPLVTENDPIGSTPTQSTRTAINSYVISELNAIIDSLPPTGAAPFTATYGRATAPAAQMLLAEIYLNDSVYTGTAQWSNALTAAQAVINSGFYALDANFHHMFLADNNTSTELIFAIPQDGLHTETYGGVTFLVHASVGGSMSAPAYGIDGGWYGLRLKPEAYNFFTAGDTRAAFFYSAGQTVSVASIPNFNDGIAAPKFQNVTSTGKAGSNPTFVDTDFPMFRLGEAYLIYAEAVLRGGGGSMPQALTYVNALQQRAYGDTLHKVATLTLPFILAERGRELLWEAHRRTDLVRFGEFTGPSYIWSWKGGTQAGMSTDAHLNLYPIPANELIANPNLKQNPGY